MGKAKLPEIGDKVEIEAPNYLKSDFKKNLVSQVMDIVDEHHYFIATPIVNNVLAPIPMGEIIKVKYAKKDVGVYYFKARVIKRKNIDNISYMLIERLAKVSRTQRRNFFRLEILLNVLISIRDSNNEEVKEISTLAKDISGGGIRVISKEPISLQRMVTLTIETRKGPIEVEGRIIRCSPYKESDFDIGIIFEDISEAVRSKIIAFIFDEQRKLRKKGLI